MISARAAAWYSCASRCIRSTSSAARWRTLPGALLGLGARAARRARRASASRVLRVLEEARGLALGGVTGAGGIRLGLGEHRLGELAHPGRLRLGLGEPVAALGGGAAQQGLHPVPVGARALGELVVVRAGPGVGVGLGLGEDLADRALRPRQVGLRAGDDLVGLGLRVGEQRGGVGAGLVEQLLGGGARAGVAGLDLGEQGRDLGLGVAAVPRWRTRASRGAAGRGRRRWSRAAGRARRRAPRAPGPSAPGARAPPGRAGPWCSRARRGPARAAASARAWASARRASACSSASATASSLALVARARSSEAWSAASASMISTSARVSSRRRSASSRDASTVACSCSSSWDAAWVSPRTRVASARASLTSRLASARSWSARFWARVSRDSASSTGLTGAARPASPVVASRVDPSDTRPMIADVTECRGPSRSIRASGPGRLARAHGGRWPRSPHPRRSSACPHACSRPSPSPRDTRTRSATRSPTRSSTRCSPRTRAAASPSRRWSPPGWSHVAGEVTTEAYVEIPKIVRDTVLDDRLRLARRRASTAHSCGVSVSIGEQCPDIAQGVDTGLREPHRRASTRSTSRAPATRA